eukprot:5188790-Amphidinium_carterae.1
MDLADTVATFTSVDVGLATSLTLVKILAGPSWLSAIECQPRRVVSDCKGVVKALQVIQVATGSPKRGIVIWKCEPGTPFLKTASSGGSKPTSLAT